jgi:hypothetical protein
VTSWSRKQIRQHKELRDPAFKQRVVPLKRKEIKEKAEELEAEQEIEKMKNEFNSG